MALKPILVTGSHRSGSTWVGKMLALSDQIHYIHEPFKPAKYRPGICGVKFNDWFAYISAHNEKVYKADLTKTVGLQYNWRAKIRHAPSLHTVRHTLAHTKAYRQHRQDGRVALLKDPIALFSTEWLAKTFGMEVVVLIRHPAAFVESVKRKNWDFDFREFARQPMLMENMLSPFSAEIDQFIRQKQSILLQACLLWRIFYHVVYQYQLRYSDQWYFYRHEDLSTHPVTSFRQLFQQVGLTFSPKIAEKVIQYSTSRNMMSEVQRDSRSNAWKWKTLLSRSEIDQIRHNTEHIAEHFYTNAEW